MTELPPCHTFATALARRVPRVEPLVNCVTLGEAWRNETALLCLLLSLSLSIITCHNMWQLTQIYQLRSQGKGDGAQGQRSVRHGANFCGPNSSLDVRVYYEAFNALNCEITTTRGGEITTVTTTIMATKRPLINNKLNTHTQ